MIQTQPITELGVDIWFWDNADWLGRTDALFGTLNAAECARRDRQHSHEKGLIWAISRARVRARLAEMTGVDAADLEFEDNGFGRPLLAGQDLSFSVSHDGTRSILAVSSGAPVGVDIESVQTLSRDEMDWPLSPIERAHLSQVAPENLSQAFFRYWTLKEAFIKALGLGVSFPLHDFDMSPFGADPTLLRVKGHGAAVRDWTFVAHEIRPNQRFALAVKTGGEPAKITYHAKKEG